MSDEGPGFEAAGAASTAGTGLQSMADRLAALGGALDIRSAPGRGTTITGRVPVGLTAPQDGRGEPTAAVQAAVRVSGPNSDLGR